MTSENQRHQLNDNNIEEETRKLWIRKVKIYDEEAPLGPPPGGPKKGPLSKTKNVNLN